MNRGRIEKCPLPANALLGKYARRGCYTDCYTTVVPRTVTHARFVTSFYTTWLFRIERLILKWLVSRPSSDDEARQLAEGHSDTFAAWSVEDRSENQLLLCDLRERTRSWLMVMPIAGAPGAATRLYFGSAVVLARSSDAEQSSPGLLFRALIGFHKLYSVALLRAARSAILSRPDHVS